MKRFIPITICISFIAFSCGLLPTSVTKNGVKIQYTKAVTKDEANKLLIYLDDSGFSDGNQKDLKLDKSGDNYLLKMVIRKDYDLNEKNLELMTDFACEISKDVYGGKLVTLELCSDTWAVKKSLKSENCDQFEMLDKKSRKFGEVELFYGESIPNSKQQDVGDYLVDVFGNDVDRTFVIDKKDGKGILSIVVTSKEYYNNPEKKDLYRIIACDLTKILGYESVVHMCDEYMKMQEVVKASKCDK